MKELGVACQAPAELYCDNKVVAQIAANPIFYETTKHIEIDCHTIREKINDGTVKTKYI